MGSIRRTTVKLVTVLVATCVLQVYVIGRGSNPSSGSSAADLKTPVHESVLGSLTIPDDRLVTVNGNSVSSGSTIFSGSQIQTSDQVDAIVKIGLSELYVQPNTDLTLTFDKENVDLKIVSGNAFVTAPKEVKYSITAPDGTISSGTGDAAPPTPAKWSKKKKAAVIIPIVLAAIFVPLCIAKCGENESTVR